MVTTKNVAGEGEIAGCLIAFGPGQSLNSTEEQRVAGWNPFIEKVDEYTKGWWEDYVRCRFSHRPLIHGLLRRMM